MIAQVAALNDAKSSPVRRSGLLQRKERSTARLALDPSFTIRRLRAANAWSGNPTFLAGRERQCEGLRLAGVPEG
jgi:hypothetical protein